MVTLREKTEGFSVEDNGFTEILHCPKTTVLNAKKQCEVVHRRPPIRVTLRERAEGFSAEDNGFIEILHCPELIVPSPEMNCEVVQRH